MADFFAELKRRQIYRIAATYLVVAWLSVQVVNNLSPALRLPEWASTLVVVLLFIGFPITLILAWVQHMPSEGGRPAPNAVLDWTLLGALALVLLFMGYQQLPPTRPAGVEEAKKASLNPGSAISLAVLPFANLSGDASQEFFSDGVTEEITSALAKIPDLRVVARTSAYQFKEPNRDVQAIAQALRATHLIEGSVRKAGTRLRITAQLINADNGSSIWTESYDRELTDIFVIQEDIARAIASSLRMPLGLAPGDSLVRGTQNVGVYQEYLQARAWYRDRTTLGRGPFLETLESVVARDPGFAPAWALLSRAYLFQTVTTPAVELGPADEAGPIVRSIHDKAARAAQKAIELDPGHAAGYAALANILLQEGRWAEAEDLLKRALTLDPSDTEALNNYGFGLLLRTGRTQEALVVSEQLRTLEPLVVIYETNTAMLRQVLGEAEAAIGILESIPAARRSALGYVYLARAYAAVGRYADGADALLQIIAAFGPRVSEPDRTGLEAAAAVLRTAPAVAANPQGLPEFGPLRGELIFIYAAVGAFDRAMDHPDRAAQNDYLTDFGKTVWSPMMAPIRKTERFKRFVRNAGLVDYWKARGWPELCKPVGADDFECS